MLFRLSENKIFTIFVWKDCRTVKVWKHTTFYKTKFFLAKLCFLSQNKHECQITRQSLRIFSKFGYFLGFSCCRGLSGIWYGIDCLSCVFVCLPIPCRHTYKFRWVKYLLSQQWKFSGSRQVGDATFHFSFCGLRNGCPFFFFGRDTFVIVDDGIESVYDSLGSEKCVWQWHK